MSFSPQSVGGWPSFHDSEVVRFTLDRGGEYGPSLDAEIHVFDMTSEVDAKGYFVLRKRSVVTFRFEGVSNSRFDGFNQQNVLRGLWVERIDPAANEGMELRVAMPSIYGVDTSFDCKTARVLGLRAA
jgi:hypothetical protein